MNEKRKEWIERAYALVAEDGFERLSVNSISRLVGKSKSSFYHHFGDLELFKTDLLDYHVKQVNIFSGKISKSDNIYPSLIHVFVEHQSDIFFHKQLRIHRRNPTYKKHIENIFQVYENAVLEQWNIHFSLNHQKLFSKKLIRFISEHFFLSITYEEYTFDWLKNYLNQIFDLIQHMKTV
jgi:AcrR family transcriptional regulator